jgi:hypothetical protein
LDSGTNEAGVSQVEVTSATDGAGVSIDSAGFADAAVADVDDETSRPVDAGQTGLVDSGGAGTAPTRVVLFAAPTTIIAAPYEDTVIFGQLQDDAGNPVLTRAETATPIKVMLSSSNALVLAPYYSASDERGTLVFERWGSPNWAFTYFKATSTPGTATVSGSAAGLTVVPVQVSTVAKGGAAAALRVFAQPGRVPSGGTRAWFPVIQIVDSVGVPTYRTFSFDLAIASNNTAVCTGGSLFFKMDFNHTMATISVPGTLGTATLTASATGLTPGTDTLTVVP